MVWSKFLAGNLTWKQQITFIFFSQNTNVLWGGLCYWGRPRCPVRPCPRTLNCAAQSFSFLETWLMQSVQDCRELCESQALCISVFCCWRYLRTQLGCLCFILSTPQSRCCRTKHRANCLMSAHYFKINNSIPWFLTSFLKTELFLFRFITTLLDNLFEKFLLPVVLLPGLVILQMKIDY